MMPTMRTTPSPTLWTLSEARSHSTMERRTCGFMSRHKSNMGPGISPWSSRKLCCVMRGLLQLSRTSRRASRKTMRSRGSSARPCLWPTKSRSSAQLLLTLLVVVS
ncbi:hypothetical protein B0H17DRAFT_1092420 [Mycena rosella]|uniref:Uncharacterized protein n=1 Tax=Mycena rosella TaxID=1033263 RepID=A0AAD7CTS1_MYCRO|nr:hypothetical protein B0H17DRAFT_1092420 [Mycena rosella]